MPQLETRRRVLLLIFAVGVVALLLVGRIPQDPAYHVFADGRELYGIPNFWNVVSNLPFVAAGVLGLWRLPRLCERESRLGYLLLCAGAFLVGAGSAYYHRAPSNATLLWDRMPMSGHSLKHVAAAIAVSCLLLAVPVRPRTGRSPLTADSR